MRDYKICYVAAGIKWDREDCDEEVDICQCELPTTRDSTIEFHGGCHLPSDDEAEDAIVEDLTDIYGHCVVHIETIDFTVEEF